MARHVVGKRGETAVVAPHPSAVEPHLGRRPHAAEMQQHALAGKRTGHAEVPEVEAFAVGRVLELAVDGLLEALHSPARRHLDRGETARGARRVVKPRRRYRVGLARARGIAKLPVAVDADALLRRRHRKRHGHQ